MPDTDGNLRKVAIAIAAHPDDIVFMMAGTLLLLNEVGWETHYLNISSGNCGSINLNSKQTETKRLEESRATLFVLRVDGLIADAQRTAKGSQKGDPWDTR